MGKRLYVNSAYGGLRPGKSYRIVERGRDWFLIRYQGKLIYVPDNLEGDPPRRRKELLEYEDFI